MANSESTDKLGLYDFKEIEDRWQHYWEENQTFRTPHPGEPGADLSKPKFYILDMFPYPSGAGLHVGHPLGYCATDIIARYKRMRGFNVLHPMGFDAFGLPAEQYAIEHGVHPAQTTKANLDTYRRQLKMFGFTYDWSREVATCDPSYYKFTQWVFLQMFGNFYDDQCRWTDPQGNEVVGRARPVADLTAEFESGRWGVDSSLNLVRDSSAPGRREWSDLTEAEQRRAVNNQRLAFIDEVPVNWCPALGTVLANEEVDNDGKSDRGGHPVFRRPLRQWMLRITKYSDRLLTDLDELDWPEPIKIMQRNWVGRSTGADVIFPLADQWEMTGEGWKCICGDCCKPPSYADFPGSIRVYTTRPDTLFGAKYMVPAPEHELVEQITTPEQKEAVAAYVAAARRRSELDRTTDTKEKTGVFTGAYAINPVNGERIPIWVADYVLMGYGTGAIMAVPAHDTRDFEFAKVFDLPIVSVVKAGKDWLREHVADRAIDMAYCERHGLTELGQNILDLADKAAVEGNDDGWIDETVMPAFIDAPAIFSEGFIGEGVAINSERFDGLSTAEFKQQITEWLDRRGTGKAAVNFKLRDWIFSRQKYWGEPFPVLHSQDGETIALSESELPLELPPMKDFKPTPVPDDQESLPEPPLGRAKEWVAVERDGKSYRRDLNTMPQWAGSCWYYLRFIDPCNTERFCDRKAEKYWMPIDLYVGGAEHAVLHLLYARFWHKVLFDLGHVTTREPFKKLFNQGMIQGFAYRTSRGATVGPDEVEERGTDEFALKDGGEPVTRIIAKMSKSLKNVVNPDGIISQYGADTFRLYEMYMGPLDAAKPWNTRDVPGLFKLCQRIWRLAVDERTGELSSALVDEAADEQTRRVLHKAIKRVTEDLEQLKLNTAITALFDFVNAMTPLKQRPREVIEPFVLLLSPFTPHLAEELWRRLGHEHTLSREPWPMFDEKLARDEEVQIAVQILGKVKARIMVPADADEKTMEKVAMADERIKAALSGKTVRKVIVVKGRLVNIVAN